MLYHESKHNILALVSKDNKALNKGGEEWVQYRSPGKQKEPSKGDEPLGE
jgi:hypothetical protein